MKQQRILLRRAAWLLFAAAALPSTASLAQDASTTQTPPVTQPPAPDSAIPPAAQPDPVVTPPAAPPVVQSTPTPTPAATAPTPVAQAPAAPETRTTTRSTRTTTGSRVTTQPRSVSTARTASRAAPATPAAAPAATTAQPAATPAAPAPAPAAAPATLPVPQQPASDAGAVPTWMLLAGGVLLLLAALALFGLWRRRRRRAEDEVYDDETADHDEPVYHDEPIRHDEPVYYDEPRREPRADPAFAAAAPVAAGAAAMAADRREHRETLSTPMGDVVRPEEFDTTSGQAVAVAEDVSVAEPDPADIEALAASSAAPEGRPWLELLMRPVRAGTSNDAAVVEYELTVGNTGSAPARDVRIATFMFPAGSSEMERMLIEPPTDGAVEQGEIRAGEATRIEGQVALPRNAIEGRAVLPVLLADVRYRAPDGTEGRTRASFEVGIPSSHGLDPFPIDRISGLLESVEARLHGEPERV